MGLWKQASTGETVGKQNCKTRGPNACSPFRCCEDGKIAKDGNLQWRSEVEKAVQLCWDVNLPMHKHAATTIETFLNKPIGRGKVLQQVFVLYIVDLDNHVLERAEQVFV
jgi:hypothetical protein